MTNALPCLRSRTKEIYYCQVEIRVSVLLLINSGLQHMVESWIKWAC
jgi:hypothetical protein